MIEGVENIIPHRAPFLFIDRVVEMEGQRILAEKTFGGGTDFYRGHYPGNPITPGVILCEAVFQAAAILILKHYSLEKGVPVLAKIEEARFKSIVRPNEKLSIEATLEEKAGKFFLMSGNILKSEDIDVLKIRFCLALG
jgi:3-hydroxyacyl-[acyl-carrier-protein] dehydratase